MEFVPAKEAGSILNEPELHSAVPPRQPPKNRPFIRLKTREEKDIQMNCPCIYCVHSKEQGESIKPCELIPDFKSLRIDTVNLEVRSSSEEFFDCVDMDELTPVPLLSSLASPRGVRKRLKRFFLSNNLPDMSLIEGCVERIRTGESSETQVFENLKKLCKEECEEKDQDDEQVSLQVQFNMSVLHIRTDMGGEPLQPQRAALREPHTWKEKLQETLEKKQKRKVPRLRKDSKIQLYGWREDLRPAVRKKKPLSLGESIK